MKLKIIIEDYEAPFSWEINAKGIQCPLGLKEVYSYLGDEVIPKLYDLIDVEMKQLKEAKES